MAMAYSGGFNPEKLKQSLFRKADRTEKAVVEAVEQAAELIRDEARANVPVDTGNLESAIHISNRKTRRGNHAVDIEVSGTGEDGRDVASYAMEIHENYQSYNPGEKTQAKRAADPTHYVGEKYMERAVDEKKEEAVDLVRKAVRQAMR
jgi:hypothetical protein